MMSIIITIVLYIVFTFLLLVFNMGAHMNKTPEERAGDDQAQIEALDKRN